MSPLKGGNPKSLAEITFSPPPPLFALGWIRQSRFPSSRKGGGGDESTFQNLSPLLFAFTPQPTTHHTFRRRAAASSLPLPLSLPHFQWKGLTSPFRIDGGEALGFIFLAHPHPLFQGDENDIHTEIHIRKVYRLRLPNSRQSESKFRTSGGDQRRRDLHVHVGL